MFVGKSVLAGEVKPRIFCPCRNLSFIFRMISVSWLEKKKKKKRKNAQIYTDHSIQILYLFITLFLMNRLYTVPSEN